MAEVKYPKPTELDPNTYQEPVQDIVDRSKKEREAKKAATTTPATPTVKKAGGGSIKSASARADGCCIKGKTRA